MCEQCSGCFLAGCAAHHGRYRDLKWSLAVRFICDPLSPDFRNFETTGAQGVVAGFESSPTIPLLLTRRRVLEYFGAPGELSHASSAVIRGGEKERINETKSGVSLAAVFLATFSQSIVNVLGVVNTETRSVETKKRRDELRARAPDDWCNGWMQLRLRTFGLSRRRINERSRGVVTLVKSRV